MKKIILLSVTLLTTLNLFAQTVVSDSVTMGGGYANQIWYSMANGEVSQQPNNNWELAFSTGIMSSNGYINGANGVNLYQVPNTNISGWSTLDTTGFNTWQHLNNSDTTWKKGAFDQNAQNFPDFGWGIYNMTTHEVTGDSLFLVRLTSMGNPDEFKKLWLIKKTVTGDWIIRYANLDNTGDVTDTLLVSNYSGKNFSYYSLRNQMEVNREPLTSNWDITFTRYTAHVLVAGCIPGTGYFSVTGVLQNEKVVSAQANGVDFSSVDFANYQSQLDSNISTIGFDWKCSGALTDSVVYFVKANGGSIWKLQFTKYEGGSTGKIVFNKEYLGNVGIASLNGNENSMIIYPNPSSGNSTLIVDAKKSSEASFGIYNTLGELIATQSSLLKTGLNLIHLNTEAIADGIYFVRNSSEKNSVTLKLIIAR